MGAGGGAAPAVGAAPAAGGAAAAAVEAPKEEKAKEEEKEESDDDMVSPYAFTQVFLNLVADTHCVCRASVFSTNLHRSPAFQPLHCWYYCTIHCILHLLP